MSARHALDAVLTAGERRFEREERDHLRQSVRDHREIDALAADRERTENSADRRRYGDAAEDAEFGREAPYLADMRGDVGGAAHERGMAEGQQSDISEQQVESTGEQRHAQPLHQEHRIEEIRRHQRQADQRRRPDPDYASLHFSYSGRTAPPA